MSTLDISWRSYGKPVDAAVVKSIENSLGVEFPRDFIDYAKKYHGGMPNKTDFDYFDPVKGAKAVSGLGQLLSFDLSRPMNIVKNYQTLADDNFPKGIIPFANTAGGDQICFDYRQNPATPSVVLWKHERHVEESIVPLATTFTDFLKMLYEPED